MNRWIKLVIAAVSALIIVIGGFVVWFEATLYRPQGEVPSHLLITGATVLVGTELETRENHSILIEDGVIVALGNTADQRAPDSAEVLDLPGMVIVPGLIDGHIHLGVERDADQGMGPIYFVRLVADAMRQFPAARRGLLEHGVTTARDLGSDLDEILEVRRQLDELDIEGPRLLVAGPVFSTRGGHPVVTVHGGDVGGTQVPETPGEARQAVRELAAAGVDVIKVVQERGGGSRDLEPIDTGVLDAIVSEAHLQDLRVTAHWGRLADLAEVLSAGVDELQHLESRDLIDGWPSDVLNDLVDRQIPISSTMVVAQVSLPDDVMDNIKARVAEFYDAGGVLIAASDAGMPGVPYGLGLHRELELFVEIGMTPRDALRSATSLSAAAMGRDDIGAIQVGRQADLVVINGDILSDIRYLGNIRLVLRDGRVAVDNR